jgi:RNA polymerase sigma factor (TIGR02999 family)
MAANMMRRVLVDYARRRGSAKRGGGAIHVSLIEAANVSAPESADMLALDDALQRLEALDPRKSRIVEMRFFGGLTLEETAEALNVPVATVRRDWSFARTWLFRELKAEGKRTLV